jgi:hypothetical protein
MTNPFAAMQNGLIWKNCAREHPHSELRKSAAIENVLRAIAQNLPLGGPLK